MGRKLLPLNPWHKSFQHFRNFGELIFVRNYTQPVQGYFDKPVAPPDGDPGFALAVTSDRRRIRLASYISS